MKWLLTVFWLVGLAPLAIAQERTEASYPAAPILLDARKPSAFISFERFGKRSDVREGETDDGIYLRFHNNSKFSMYLKTNGADDENSDHRVSYEVRCIPGMGVERKEKELPIGTLLFHKTRIRRISSGKSIVFSVPRTHLSEGLAVYVLFSYEWELLGQSGGDFSIVHQAQFWSTNLSASVPK